MRGLADAERLRRFLRELAREADADAAVYITGGAIEPRLHRYPAVDPPSFRKRLDETLRPRS